MSNILADKALDIGTLIADRYRVERVLGSGGMGFVYLAVDSLLGEERVAVKVLHESFADDRVQTARFLREVQLMRKVNHKNVVRTYDVGTDGKHIYFTMEFVPGRQLEEVIGDRGIAIDDIPKYVVQICEGLQAIHAAGVIHRDLKPGNILVQKDGSIRITDFGVARPETSNLTAHDEIVGSVCYMAPEMWLGQSLTPAVDLYALGIIMYEMCTGDVPFDGDSPGALMRLHLDREPIPPRDRNTRVPPWLNKLILRLLAKSPQERPRDPREIADYIKTHADSGSIGAVANESTKAAAEFFQDLESGLQGAQVSADLRRSEGDSGKQAEKDGGQRVRRRTLGGKGINPNALGVRTGLQGANARSQVDPRFGRSIGLSVVWIGAAIVLALFFPPLFNLSDVGTDTSNLIAKIESVAAMSQEMVLRISLARIPITFLQLCLPLVLVGLAFRSSDMQLRLLIRALFFFACAAIALAVYFLSALPDIAGASLSSLVSVAITTREQLTAVAFLSPVSNIYEQVIISGGLLQAAIAVQPVTTAPLLFALQGLLLFGIFALSENRNSLREESGGFAQVLFSTVMRTFVILTLIVLEGTFFGANVELNAWYSVFGIELRLSGAALACGALNWIVVAFLILQRSAK